MFGSVTIRRAIATSRPTTLLTGAQMHPGGTNLHALLADALVRMFDVGDGVDVRADFVGHDVLIIALLECFINLVTKCQDEQRQQ